MRKPALAPAGKIHSLTLDSALLKGNRLRDATTRQVLVYTPPGYDPARRYPLMMDLVGYMGSGASHTNWRPFGRSLPERLDHLLATGAMDPTVVVMPDCYTCLGGNQYIDSVGTGPYMSHLIHEVLPLVEREFAVVPDRSRRAVFGKSSGGYGALVHGMLKADVWGAIACHSGDAYFEYGYLPDFPKLLKELLKYEGSLEKLLEAAFNREKLGHDLSHALMIVGMAAHYDGDAEVPLGFHLPFDPHSGRIDPARWERWLRWDPVRMVETHGAALRSLRGLYIDCGRRDQYHLLWGARMVRDSLVRQAIPHRYEEFDDDHSDVDYRMDVSLPYLSAAIRGDG